MKKELLLSLLIAGSTLNGYADEARLLRFPATNGQEVVFSYGGDLFKASINGGEATRLTSHIGYEMFARYSPDGQSIAFTGEYDGNREVYLISKNGGEPKRLTFTSTNSRDDLGDRMGPNNMVLTWTTDGKSVVYRNRISDSFDGKLWTISKDGGMSEEIPLPEGGFCSYSPDGKKLAYNRVMREFDMTMNIFVYNTQTKQTEKVTNYSDFDVKFPSTNGQIIVYEKGGYLYKLDPKTRQSVKISITLNSDNIYGRKEYRDLSENITAASVSADGNRLAVTARGEVFDIPAKQGVVKNITRSPGANDRGAQISPDGKYIAYISDKTGETEVWLQEETGGEPMQLTKNNDTYIRSLVWSPDSKTILYTDRKNRLVEVNVAAKSKRTVITCPESEFRGVQFSPDSQWITYTRPEKNDMSVVYVYNLKTNKEYPVTEKWYSSSSPTFSTDGKYLIFNSNRDLNPIYSRVEWDYAYTSMGGIYLATLTKDTPSPLLPKDDQISVSEDKAAGPQGPGKPGEAKDAKNAEVKIDTDGIFNRIIKLPVRPGEGYMSYFFSDGYVTESGEELSTRKIKAALRDIVDAEDSRNPMSDDAIKDALAEKGFPIARRTVAKYREQLGIPIARLRKS